MYDSDKSGEALISTLSYELHYLLKSSAYCIHLYEKNCMTKHGLEEGEHGNLVAFGFEFISPRTPGRS